MAKGKARSIDERIAEIDGKIEGLQEKINDLKAQRKELIETEKKAKVEKLVEFMEKNNITIDELFEKANS